MSDDETQQRLDASLARERWLRTLLDHTFQFIGALSVDGVLIEANQTALDLIGARREDVLGRHFADTPWWTHSSAQQERLHVAIEAARSGRLDRFETTHPDRDGSVHTIDFSIKPLVTEGVVSHLVVEGRDITDRKQAEEALQASRVMLSLVLDAIPVRVFWKDAELRYLGCNRPFATDAGVDSVEAVLGKTDFDFAWRPEAERYQHDDRTVLRSGRAILNYEEPQTSPTGEELWLRTSKVPLRDRDGVVVGVLGVYEDITERKREEQQRLALERRVQGAQKLESLGLLAGGVAHDFNNLLTAIVGHVELLRTRVGEGPDTAATFREVTTAARRASDLCRHLLAYSGGGRGEIVPVDVNTVVGEMVSLLRVSISRRARLVVSLAEDLPHVDADATQLRQVVMNLLTNASDAVAASGGEIHVRTSVRVVGDGPVPGGSYVEIEAQDDGVGMDDETRARIFEPFFTTKGPSRGLGLAAVLGIVEQHGGTIEVDSQPGSGTSFRVLLPASAQRAAVVEPPAPQAVWRGHGRVLVVDDDPDALSSAAALVRHLGFDVDTATDGRAAVERYAVGRYELVLLDLHMGRFDGLETTRALRARDPQVKVVLTTGYYVKDLFDQLDRARPDAFLEKPFTIATLRDAVRAVLEPPPSAATVRVLYVDDDEGLTLLVQRHLERRGRYQVTTTHDGHAALERLRADPNGFDLVVTDENMPRMSGLELATAVRALQRELPIVLVSGAVSEGLRAEAARAGVTNVVRKAHSVMAICDSIDSLSRAQPA